MTGEASHHDQMGSVGTFDTDCVIPNEKTVMDQPPQWETAPGEG